MSVIYLFTSKSMGLPSGVFTSFDLASNWIKTNYLSGILTEYPVDQGCYDWAIEGGYFKEKSAIHRAPTFIEKFVSVHQENWHFEHGEELCHQNMRDQA